MERSEGAPLVSRVGGTCRVHGPRANLLLILSVFIAAATVSCQGPSSTRQFSTVLELAGNFPLPVILSDETGQVTAFESAPSADGAAPTLEVRADATRSDAFIVSWLGVPATTMLR